MIFNLFPINASAENNKTENPEIVDFKLNIPTARAAKICRKHGGSWKGSKLGTFTCNTHIYRAMFEANSRDVIYNMTVIFKNVNIYNEELNRYMRSHEEIKNVGANSTKIYEFTDQNWVAYFTSYGNNGNYTVRLYNIKELMK